ncbi:MAG: dihydrodipicolinate synthase family protein [Pseudomonadota bacterium]
MDNLLSRGVVAPILTPFNDDLSIADDLYVAHAQSLLDQGCAGLAPFGTTGEALSVGIDERIAAIKVLVDSGVDPALLVPGTGLTNIADTYRLSRACLDLGCSAVMTLPPFYFKAVTEDGLFDYFAALFSKLGSDARVFLYHIPPIAIVGISPALTARLRDAFPANVVGIKDSSGDWENTKQLFDIKDMIVYPGSELPLLEALEKGGPGCISATANLNAKAIGEVIRLFDSGDVAAARAKHASVRQFRQTVEAYAPIPAQKRLLAESTGDARWANVRPPLRPMPVDAGRELLAKLQN